MSERRYTDEEAAVIFRVAAERQEAALSIPAAGATPGAPASSEGMTLSQLQDIGREVGLPADIVAGAAGALDRLGRPTVRRFLGLPIGVGRTVPLGRKLSDEEWERLVVDLRQTFDARGRITDEGSFRQWTNGNLQALLEPTSSGHQLRLKTTKGDAYALMTTGIAMLAFGAFMVVAKSIAGGAANLAPITLVGLMGAAMFGVGALRLPGWARLRRRQMEEIAGRLTESTQS